MLTEKQSYTVAHVEAFDVMTGKAHRFTVYHDRGRVLDIRYSDGCTVRRNSEQFTETEDAFHIDRAWQVMEESDVQGYARRCYA